MHLDDLRNRLLLPALYPLHINKFLVGLPCVEAMVAILTVPAPHNAIHFTIELGHDHLRDPCPAVGAVRAHLIQWHLLLVDQVVRCSPMPDPRDPARTQQTSQLDR